MTRIDITPTRRHVDDEPGEYTEYVVVVNHDGCQAGVHRYQEPDRVRLIECAGQAVARAEDLASKYRTPSIAKHFDVTVHPLRTDRITRRSCA